MSSFWVRVLITSFILVTVSVPLILLADYNFRWSLGELTYTHTSRVLDLFHGSAEKRNFTRSERLSTRIRLKNRQEAFNTRINCTQVPDLLKGDAPVVKTCAASFRHGCFSGSEDVERVNLTRGLLADFEPYREGFKRKDLQEMIDRFPESDTLCLIEIRKGKILFPRRPDSNFNCIENCNIHMRAAVDELEKGIVSGQIQIPDTQFFLNVNDNSVCRHRFQVQCTTPLLGLQKDRAGTYFV